jgi:lysophospholipid acyltransferase (LPLAT)-like uncharacterized protein
VKFRKPWQHRLIGRLGNVLLRVLSVTWRRRILLPEAPEPGLYIFLHGNIIPAAVSHFDRGHSVIISTHRDGEIIGQIAQRLGYRTIRGSSTRGGAAAIRAIIRAGREHAVAVTPDGPRGPIGKVEPTLVGLAARMEWRIHPLGFAVSRAWRAKSWDRFVVPKPFARIVCVPGTPISVPAGLDREQSKSLAQVVARSLAEAEEAAERALAAW